MIPQGGLRQVKDDLVNDLKEQSVDFAERLSSVQIDRNLKTLCADRLGSLNLKTSRIHDLYGQGPVRLDGDKLAHKPAARAYSAGEIEAFEIKCFDSADSSTQRLKCGDPEGLRPNGNKAPLCTILFPESDTSSDEEPLRGSMRRKVAEQSNRGGPQAFTPYTEARFPGSVWKFRDSFAGRYEDMLTIATFTLLVMMSQGWLHQHPTGIEQSQIYSGNSSLRLASIDSCPRACKRQISQKEHVAVPSSNEDGLLHAQIPVHLECPSNEGEGPPESVTYRCGIEHVSTHLLADLDAEAHRRAAIIQT
ncbi:hypothetical protein CLCR_08892 [Cladophialophora carrionii]|uniref:Uncharacterized protein n=1 Tax=Cladophialophora carrionii TaxID=86049 RepID=A0A1C1CUL4_9EURO|nr:hypothetical protein CLCR_08892 [Cladophialophora carrionii]